MDKMIEVRYAGVVVGRSAIVRELDTRGLFLGITEPMPVGTAVVLRIADGGGTDVPGKVEVVSESQELAHAGMRVRFTDPASATLFGTPVQAPPEPEPQPQPQPQPNPEPSSAPPSAAVASVPGAATATRDQAAPDASGTTSSATGGHRRIVIDASADRARAEASAAVANAADAKNAEGAEAADGSGDDSDQSDAAGNAPGGAESGRIPAPDPSAFSGGGGKKGRRNRRR